MKILTTGALAAAVLFSLPASDGLRAQEEGPGKQPEKENSARENPDAGSRAGQRPGRDASGAGRISPMAKLFELMDRDGDGAISSAEMDGFIAKVDSDGDGRVSDDELRARMRSILGALRGGGSGRSGRPGGSGRSRGGRERRSADDPRVSKETLEAANALRRATHSGNLPAPGARAPDFKLSLLDGSARPDYVKPDGEGKVSLSSHKGKKPVVLIFGSYT